MLFSFFANKKNLTVEKLHINKYKNKSFNRPIGNNKLWLAEEEIWYKFSEGKLIDNFKKNMEYFNHTKYKYDVDIDMTNIYILRKSKIKSFLNKYIAIPTVKQIQNNDESFRYSIDWNRFIHENPKCTGIYVNFDPLTYINKDARKKKEMTYDVIFIGSWLISSICIWDKSIIKSFNYIKEMKIYKE
jgi:hypothetical protein